MLALQTLAVHCASSNRIIELLPHQSLALQEGLFNRTYTCHGDECSWCRNNKTLGPSVLEFQGEPSTVSWYAGGEIRAINQDTVELIEQYEMMHAELAQAAG